MSQWRKLVLAAGCTLAGGGVVFASTGRSSLVVAMGIADMAVGLALAVWADARGPW